MKASTKNISAPEKKNKLQFCNVHIQRKHVFKNKTLRNICGVFWYISTNQLRCSVEN